MATVSINRIWTNPKFHYLRSYPRSNPTLNRQQPQQFVVDTTMGRYHDLESTVANASRDWATNCATASKRGPSRWPFPALLHTTSVVVGHPISASDNVTACHAAGITAAA